MVDSRIQKFAQILVRYSICAQEKEEVIINGSVDSAPLIRALYEELIMCGAYPRIRAAIPGIDYIFYRNCADHQLDHVSTLDYVEAENVAAMISIQSDYNTRELMNIDPKRITRRQKARKEIKDIILKRVRWNVTLYPTYALAQEADMSLQEYEDFVYGALFADQADPIQCWESLAARQSHLGEVFSKGKDIRITGKGTDIFMKVEGRTFVSSDGKHNMPSGEVFSSPIENSVNGVITYEYPVCLHGKEVEGVRLVFKDGKVTEASAEKNQDFLIAMLDTDAGARYVGEIGIGNNFGITRFTKNILFDEKIGGSVHIALGQSFRECGGKNDSAIHWDMIKDLRDGGELYLDGVLVQKNGNFLI